LWIILIFYQLSRKICFLIPSNKETTVQKSTEEPAAPPTRGALTNPEVTTVWIKVTSSGLHQEAL
jgi:hypothetical protein